jgi:hypothetical protein
MCRVIIVIVLAVWVIFEAVKAFMEHYDEETL